MDLVQIKLKVITDNTGSSTTIPALLTNEGLILPLVRFFIRNYHVRSISWMLAVTQSVRLLIEYMEANRSNLTNSYELFSSFSQKLYLGTIGEDGYDSSGLYWSPKSTNTANRLISMLTVFCDDLNKFEMTKHMNPLVEADSYNKKINFAAWYRNNKYDYLGHIKNVSKNNSLSLMRRFNKRRVASRSDEDKVFDENLFPNFFLNGIGKRQDIRAALRDQLILLLLHGAGCRESEPFHLWPQDVFNCSKNYDNVTVRIFHPEDGKAPDSWQGKSGERHRAAYLINNYGLQPRNKLYSTQRAGWKCKVNDSRESYIQLHWFSSYYGIVFKRLWTTYLKHLSFIDREHPYAFISFHPQYLGKPYTINAFNDNYKSALRRVGLTPSKSSGLSPHGHRHAYKKRLIEAQIDPVIIMKAMHHSNIQSQEAYASPSIRLVTNKLNDASDSLNDNKNNINAADSWDDFIKLGLDNI